MATLTELHERVEALVHSAWANRIRREGQLIEKLRDDTLSSGAMPGEFTMVLRYRRGELLRPEIR